MLLRPKKNLVERYGANSYALVSGATNPLGKEISRQLAKRGFNIILLSGDEDQLIAMARELRPEVPNKEFRVFPVNMEECSNVNFYQDILEQLKALDISILVNNTDLDYYDAFGNIKVKQCKSMIFVNCIPPVLLTRAFLPKLTQRTKRSAVINVSCGAAVFPMAYYSAYVGTKALVDNFTKCLSMEFPQIDIMLYTPFDFVEKKGDEFYDLMTITAEESVNGALNDLGYQRKSYGHWRHRLQGFLYEKSPRWLFKHIYLTLVAPKFMTHESKS